MEKTIKGKFSNGKIEPLEEVDLVEGEEVSIVIKETSDVRNKSDNSLRAAAGSWKGKINAERLIRNIYRDRLLSTRKAPRL